MSNHEQLISELREENRQLKKLLFGDFKIPWEWKLSPSQTSIISCLIAREEVSFDTLILAVYQSYDRAPEFATGVIRHQMRRMKDKLESLGITIHTKYGFGYYMDPEDRKNLRKRLNIG